MIETGPKVTLWACFSYNKDMTTKEKKYWLLKTEPSSYSIDDFKKDKKTAWTGVRNYQARNSIREMNKDDLFLFYHSGSNPPAVVGIGEVSSSPYADPTQFDPKDSHFDPKASKAKPIWFAVDVRFKKKFQIPFDLPKIKNHSTLKNMLVAKQGSRLSVQGVLEKHFHSILG